MNNVKQKQVSDKEKFYSVINQFDFLSPYWDQESHGLRRNSFEKRLGTMSSGEYHLAAFMANVWFNSNEYDFDLFDALGTVSGRFKAVIEDWVKQPYWP